MRGLPRSINSLPGAVRLSGDVAMATPGLPFPSLPSQRPTSLTAAAAGTTQRPSRKPSLGVTTDACQIPGMDGSKSSGAVGEVEKGRNEIVSALFHV